MAIPQRSRLSGLILSTLIALLAAANPLNASTKTDKGTLASSPVSLSFGDVGIGQSASMSVTLTNTGSASVTITRRYRSIGEGFSGTGLNLPTTLAAGQSTSFTMTFTPRSTGAVSGTLTIVSNASNERLLIPMSGTGTSNASLVAKPSSLSFGNVQVGSGATLSETLTNSGTSSVTISQATTTGTGFSQQGLTAPVTLAAGQSLTFSEVFTPNAAGSVSGSIAVISNANPSTTTIPLAGTGTVAGSLSASPATVNFGSVITGTTSSQTGTLSAAGASVTVSSGTSSSPEFLLSGLSFPLTISAGQSASFTVAFTPQSSGTASATLAFTSNASNSPTVESLTGTGTAPPQHSVNLSWNPSTSAVTGYNLYRSQVTGGPYTKLNSSLDALTSYTDNTVSGGQTYYYVTTAVDSKGDESSYSNQVTAVVPSP
jgi:hypothetical protein